MGINGLYSFVRSKGALEAIQLCRCQMVVDGTNLCHFLYQNCQEGWRFGGDYDKFAQEVREVMEVLLLCNVQPHVVMDGSEQVDDRRLPGKLRRSQERLTQVQACKEPLLPLLAALVFQTVLRELDVPLLVVDFQADRAIASLAKQWDCPVLSNDSDFCVFGLERGVIFIDKVNFLQPHRQPDGQHFIPAKVFYAKNLVKILELGHDTLPLFATLVGHDMFESKRYHKFLSTLDPVKIRRGLTSRHELFEKVIQWLRSFKDMEKAVERIMEVYSDSNEAEQNRCAIGVSVKHYTNISSRTFIYAKEWFEDDQSSSSDSDDQTSQSAESGSESEDDAVSFRWESASSLMSSRSSVSDNVDNDDEDSSDRKTDDHHGMPSWCAQAHRSGLVLPSMKTSFMHQKMILLCQVEDFNAQSTNFASQGIRKVAYGIIAHSMGIWSRLKGRYVEEFDRCQSTKVKADTNIPGTDERLPSLQQIPSLTVEKRLMVLAATLGVETGFLATLPEEMRLLGGVAVYWVRHSSPSVSIHHLHSLLVCVIMLHARLELRARRKAKPGPRPFDRVQESPEGPRLLHEKPQQSNTHSPESTERFVHAVTKATGSPQPESCAREEEGLSCESDTKATHDSCPKSEPRRENSLSEITGAAKSSGMIRGDPESKGTQSENTRSFGVDVPELPQSLRVAMKSWPLSDVEKIVWEVQTFHSQPDAKTAVDLAVVHGFSQLQACLLDAVLLCGALQWPVPFPLPHLLINSTFLSRFQCRLARSKHPENVVRHVLGTSVALDMFRALVKHVLSQLPAETFVARVPAPGPDVPAKAAKSTAKKSRGPKSRAKSARR